MRRILLLLLLTAIPMTAPMTAAAAGVSKADWMHGMQTALPATFCKAGWYFRECFKITAAQCDETASSSTRSCLKDVADKLPATLDENSGREWGNKVGTCVGGNFETVLASEKSDSKKCSDISNWIPK